MISRICRKTQRQIFLLVSGGHICAPQINTNMASDGVSTQSVLANISQTKYRADLILVEAFIKFNFFHFLDFGLSVWNGLHFYLQWRDSEYREY